MFPKAQDSVVECLAASVLVERLINNYIDVELDYATNDAYANIFSCVLVQNKDKIQDRVKNILHCDIFLL